MCSLNYDQLIEGDCELFKQNGRYVLMFGPSQIANDQLVRNGHKSMTNFLRVTDRRSLVDIFLVVTVSIPRGVEGISIYPLK